jgi:hypothetical protein
LLAPVCTAGADAIGAPVCAFPFSSCLDPPPHAPVVARPPAIVRDAAAGEEAVGGETGVVGAVLGGGKSTTADGDDAGAVEAAAAVLTAMKEMK